MNTFVTVLGALFMLGAAPFVIDHVSNHWYDDEYPHSGFGPDCPEWVAPEDDLYYLPEADNTDR